MDWVLFDKNFELCEINVFDDGLQEHENLKNVWKIIGTNNRGKYRLSNVYSDVEVNISCWKVSIIKKSA